MVLDELLAPISADAPCGEDLEYDAAFMEMERVAAGRPEQQIGDQVLEGEEPDWRDVKKRAIDLLTRTRDLRVATYLTRALLHTGEFPGLRDGLALLRGWIEQYWEGVHPRLDPDDDHDPTMRINTLMTLCDADTTLRVLRETPLVRSRSVGIFSLREVQMAAGEYPVPAGMTAPASSTIDAAFLDVAIEELQSTQAALQESLDHVATMETLITDYVGVGNAPSFEELRRVLRACAQVVERQLERRGVGVEGVAEEVSGPGAEAAVEGAAGAAAGSNGSPQRLTGEIHSREDVIRALDKVCEYYERHEPSSPLPLLIRRAKRLASKSFLEIIRDLAPDALGQAQAIGGLTEETEQTEEETTSNSGW